MFLSERAVQKDPGRRYLEKDKNWIQFSELQHGPIHFGKWKSCFSIHYIEEDLLSMQDALSATRYHVHCSCHQCCNILNSSEATMGNIISDLWEALGDGGYINCVTQFVFGR